MTTLKNRLAKLEVTSDELDLGRLWAAAISEALGRTADTGAVQRLRARYPEHPMTHIAEAAARAA